MGGCGNASPPSEDPLGAGTTRWSHAAPSEVPGGSAVAPQAASTALLLPIPTRFPAFMLGLEANREQVFWFAFLQHQAGDIPPPTSSTTMVMMAQDSRAFIKGSLLGTALRLGPPLGRRAHSSGSVVVLGAEHVPKVIPEERSKRGSSEWQK